MKLVSKKNLKRYMLQILSSEKLMMMILGS